jgi:hypothetical protein
MSPMVYAGPSGPGRAIVETMLASKNGSNKFCLAKGNLFGESFKLSQLQFVLTSS